MGNKFIGTQANNYLQSDPFTPIYFLPKISEETSDKEDISSNICSENIKNSFGNEDNKKRKIKISKERPGNKKKLKKENKIVFQEIFNNLELDPAFYQDDESNKYSIEDIYINFEEPKNMGNSYYSNIIFRAKKFKRNSNNLFIFDWDNTLLPTYYLAQENILNEKELPLEYLSIFSLLEDCIYKLLKISIDKGEVYIITNSSIGWVEYSANKYFPSLVKLLKNINIISAKDEFQNIFPDNKKIWKQQAFLSLKEKIILNRINNIICFGDSYIELEAGKKLASEVGKCFIKTIKFKEHPEPDDIIKQINLILNKFNYIYLKEKNLSITIEQNEM